MLHTLLTSLTGSHTRSGHVTMCLFFWGWGARRALFSWFLSFPGEAQADPGLPLLSLLTLKGQIQNFNPQGTSQVALVVKSLPAKAWDIEDMGLILGSGRSPGGGHGNPLQYSCLENPMDRGAWRARVHRVAQSQTQLKWFSSHTHTHTQRSTSRLGSVTVDIWGQKTVCPGELHLPHSRSTSLGSLWYLPLVPYPHLRSMGNPGFLPLF